MQDEKYEDFATNTNIRSQVLNIGTLTRGLIELGLVIKYLWKHGCNQAMIGSWEVLTNKQLRFWAFGSDPKIRYFSDLQGKNVDRDPELLSKNPQKSDFTFCDRVFRSNK